METWVEKVSMDAQPFSWPIKLSFSRNLERERERERERVICHCSGPIHMGFTTDFSLIVKLRKSTWSDFEKNRGKKICFLGFP